MLGWSRSEVHFLYWTISKGANNKYVDKWNHFAISQSSIFWVRGNIFKYIASMVLNIFNFMGYFCDT